MAAALAQEDNNGMLFFDLSCYSFIRLVSTLVYIECDFYEY